MARRIIDKLSKRKFLKPITTLLAVAGIAIPSGYMGFKILEMHDRQLPYTIAEDLITYNNKQMRDIAYAYLQDNPEIVDRFPDDYQTLQQLKWVILDNGENPRKQKKKQGYGIHHEIKSTANTTEIDPWLAANKIPTYQFPEEEKKKIWDVKIESTKRIKINDKPYFTNFELKAFSTDLEYLPEFELLYDKTFDNLFPLDEEKQIIHSPIEEVTDVVNLGEEMFFVQDHEVFQKRKDKPIRRYYWQVSKGNLHIKKIYGTEHAVIFDGQTATLVDNWYSKDQGTNIPITLARLIEKISTTESETHIDDITRVAYKDGCLYISSEDDIKFTDGKKVRHLPTGFMVDYWDFMVADVDGDGLNDIITYEDPDGEDRIVVRDNGGNKKYQITDVLSKYKFKFPYGEENPDLRIFNPKKLKEDIKKKLKE